MFLGIWKYFLVSFDHFDKFDIISLIVASVIPFIIIDGILMEQLFVDILLTGFKLKVHESLFDEILLNWNILQYSCESPFSFI